MRLRAVLLALVALTSVAACNRGSNVRPEDLRQSPVGAPLTADQERRVRSLQATFAEVDSSPPEKWIEDFRRDQSPDREIAVYEGMAEAYVAFVSGRTLTQAQKNDVYSLVLSRSMMKDETVLAGVKLEALTPEEAREVLKGYSRPPAPIRVVKE